MLAADLHQVLGLITCEEALLSQSAMNRPMDRRKHDLFQCQKVTWTETEGKDQEHQASYSETCDDKMTFEKRKSERSTHS